MKDKDIQFTNGSIVNPLKSINNIRGNRSGFINFYTPCGYAITSHCSCEKCIRGDCEYK